MLNIGLVILSGVFLFPPFLSAQQTTSAVCTVQATVVPAATLKTTLKDESSPTNASQQRTGLTLCGEGVILLKVDSAEQFEASAIKLQQESKEIKDRAYSRIRKIRVEYLSS